MEWKSIRKWIWIGNGMEMEWKWSGNGAQFVKIVWIGLDLGQSVD